MARRRRGGAIKTTRQTSQTRKAKNTEKINGIFEDSNSLMDTDSTNGVDEDKSAEGSANCDSRSGEPIVHHKKFGKIRMLGQNENSQDIDISIAESSKDFSQLDSKSSDENELESHENNQFSNDVGVMDIMRGIGFLEPKARMSYNDFRKQSSFYNVENDIPLDGSVIIKPGTFSSNTISSSVKPNLMFDTTTSSELSSVNFLKVLQGIEMLERKVSDSLKFERNLPEESKEFVMNTSSRTPVYLNDDFNSVQCKNFYSHDVFPLNNVKSEEEMTEQAMKNGNEIKMVDMIRSTDVSSSDDTSLDRLNDEDGATRKLNNIALDDSREPPESPGSKASDETAEKKPPGCRSRNGSSDTTGSESNTNNGAPIRRSSRIKYIGIMKQKEREQAAVKTENVMKSPLPPGSPAVTPPVSAFDEKPVKVKSRWRRSSELEMHSGKVIDSDAISSNCSSPRNTTPQPPLMNAEATPEDLERLEREQKEIEEGLRSFIVLTENEYKMERNPCKETKRMVCDCILTKEEMMRGEDGCGEDCLNRMLFLECGPRCALGERCTNKRFQKLQYANCKIFKTEKKGFGLRAEEDLSGNTFIMEYVGEVVDQKEFSRRVKMYAKDNNKHFYFMALKGDAVIDATNKGNISRFINHSCEPNAETQKWTINGELRVGFFTRRFIRAGEEITFDYQFQRYGKQAQKCYCEAPTCRGWIGENPERVEDDEDEEDEEDEDEDEYEEDEEEEEEQEDDQKRDFKKQWKAEEEKDRKEGISKPIKVSKAKIRKDKKKVDKKERKQTTIMDDMGLDEEIQKLFQTGLKNRAHTLTLSRLMVRAEDWSTRGKLLQLIREGETPCRRLFLDYHGLRLICSWMVSHELEGSADKDKRRLEILKTLAKLPIPNKNMLIDSKVLSVVEQWAKSGNIVRKLSVDEETGVQESKKSKEDAEGESEEKPKEIEEKMNAVKNEENNESIEKVKQMAETVLESWSSLKEVFKIPKKERIEQMKEHERQADRGYSEYLDNKENFRDKYDRYGRSDRYRNDRDRDRDRDRIRERKRMRDSPPDPEWLRNHERNSKMTKHERRQLFALKVLQEDEEAKKRSEQLEMWKQHESRCLALGLDPNLNAACDPQTGFPVFFDHNTGTWQNCPPSAGPSPSMPHTPSMCPSPMCPVGPPMIQNCPNCPMCTNISPMCSNISNTLCHNGIMHNNSTTLSNGPIPAHPTPGQIYPDMPPQFQPSIHQSNFDVAARPYLEPVLKDNVQFPIEENIQNEFSRPVITEVPLNIPIKLPPKWKSVKDPKGRVYYYHIKDRISQWEPPLWTEEDARIEAARTVALEMGNESSTSTESSTETSSDEEDDEMEVISKENEDSQEIKVNSDSKEGNPELKKQTADESSEKPPSERIPWIDEDKDEDLSAWEDEEDLVKSKSSEEKTASGEEKQTSAAVIPTAPPVRVRRAGLVQEIIISPRREEDRVDNRKFKETKEMLRRQKEEARAKLRLKEEKPIVKPSRNKKRRKEKTSRSGARVKSDKLPLLTSDPATDKKVKENFKNSMAGAIVSHLNPYRKQDCKIGRITCNEDFKHLARKLTHFVMLKELKHCKGIDDLECNDSVKAKAKDFIKKYMAKFGAVYQRPPHEVGKT